jgi:NAD(P)-dependent dehydrogenase (short-subunit alcohol dehydrogenase family)
MNATSQNATANISRPLAIVTGASSGIGYELARKFAQRGYDLVVAADDPERLREAADALSEQAEDAKVEIVQVDLTGQDGVRKLYESVQALNRPVDVLAANAGVGVYGEFAGETAIEDEIALINLNVTSQVHLIKLVSHDMLERGRGCHPGAGGRRRSRCHRSQEQDAGRRGEGHAGCDQGKGLRQADQAQAQAGRARYVSAATDY